MRPRRSRKNTPGGINGLIAEAKGTTEKNLPTSGFIPPEFMALAAVLTSFGILLINILVSNISMLSQIGPKILKFFVDLAGGRAVEEMSAKEIEKRGIDRSEAGEAFLRVLTFRGPRY